MLQLRLAWMELKEDMLFYNFCFAEFASANYSGVCGGSSTGTIQTFAKTGKSL